MRNSGRHVLTALCVAAILLGLVPIGMGLVYKLSVPHFILVPLNFIGWLVICMFLLSQRNMLAMVDKTLQEVGLPEVEGDLDSKLGTFLRESQRYHRASYSFQIDDNAKEADLGSSLRKIVTLAFEEFNAIAAELSLFDEDSGLWTQALLVGDPVAISSQSMLVEASNLSGTSIDEDDKSVMHQPVSFAGTLFGAIRVELAPGVVPTKSDEQVLKLLAIQGALMLVDSRFTDELLRMRRKGEESTRAKTGFLANLSHEIRGPLGIILNSVELLLDGLCGEVTESQADTLGMVKSSGDHLLDLVNDVLDYAKVEAGKVTAKPVDIRAKDLLEDLSAIIRSQAESKNHKVTLKPVSETLGIICDKRHARQMLINFLTNAVKYTPEGGEIIVKAERAANHRIQISVKDSGVGIPESERHKVFGAFERVDVEYSMEQGGTGLGMPLTKRLAEVNDGMVSFDSVEGEGSTFWINLPSIEIEPVERGVEGANGHLEIPSQGNGESILLVDHDADGRKILEHYLSSQGFEIINAASGPEVLKALKNNQIELAVVENDMPGATGEDMVAVIRGNPRAATVPIILLSAKAFVFDIERFLKLGVDRCLSKPVPLEELATTARRLIDETRSLENIKDVLR